MREPGQCYRAGPGRRAEPGIPTSVRMVVMMRIAEQRWVAAIRRLALVLALTVPGTTLAALPFPVKISAATISYQGVELEGVQLQTLQQDGLRLDVARARMAGQEG